MREKLDWAHQRGNFHHTKGVKGEQGEHQYAEFLVPWLMAGGSGTEGA